MTLRDDILADVGELTFPLHSVFFSALCRTHGEAAAVHQGWIRLERVFECYHRECCCSSSTRCHRSSRSSSVCSIDSTRGLTFRSLPRLIRDLPKSSDPPLPHLRSFDSPPSTLRCSLLNPSLLPTPTLPPATTQSKEDLPTPSLLVDPLAGLLPHLLLLSSQTLASFSICFFSLSHSRHLLPFALSLSSLVLPVPLLTVPLSLL